MGFPEWSGIWRQFLDVFFPPWYMFDDPRIIHFIHLLYHHLLQYIYIIYCITISFDYLVIYPNLLIICHNFIISPAFFNVCSPGKSPNNDSFFSREDHGLPLSIPKLDVWGETVKQVGTAKRTNTCCSFLFGQWKIGSHFFDSERSVPYKWFPCEFAQSCNRLQLATSNIVWLVISCFQLDFFGWPRQVMLTGGTKSEKLVVGRELLISIWLWISSNSSRIWWRKKYQNHQYFSHPKVTWITSVLSYQNHICFFQSCRDFWNSTPWTMWRAFGFQQSQNVAENRNRRFFFCEVVQGWRPQNKKTTWRIPLVSKSPELNVAAKVLYECWVTGLVTETMGLETTQDERESRWLASGALSWLRRSLVGGGRQLWGFIPSSVRVMKQAFVQHYMQSRLFLFMSRRWVQLACRKEKKPEVVPTLTPFVRCPSWGKLLLKS